jgi:hypothetical protein
VLFVVIFYTTESMEYTTSEKYTRQSANLMHMRFVACVACVFARNVLLDKQTYEVICTRYSLATTDPFLLVIYSQ